MDGSGTGGRRWSIGELARATGTTVRALRHYDEIGLLRAGDSTGSGHRRYLERDLRRLYRIRALRALGLSLDEIGRVLATPGDDLGVMRDVLAAQLAELEYRAERLRALTVRVRALLGRLDAGVMPGPAEFLTTLETMSVFDAHFTSDQQAALAERRSELGQEAVDAARTRWAELVGALLGHVQAQTPVDDPQVRRLVARWDELGAAFHAPGTGTEAAARRLWQDNGDVLAAALPWSHEQMSALLAYLDRVRRSR